MRPFFSAVQRSASDILLRLCCADFDAAPMLEAENSMIERPIFKLRVSKH